MSANHKKHLIQLIHIAKGQLQLDKEVYLEILADESTGEPKTSSTKMTIAELEKVLIRLKASGFKVKKINPMVDLQTHKIKQLWRQLHDAGKVNDPSEKAINTFIRRQTEIEKIEWLNSTQASKVIEALKRWLARK